MPLKHIHNLTIFDEIQKRLRPITITSITNPLQKFPQNPHSSHGNSSQFPYHPIPIPMGIPMGIPIPTAALLLFVINDSYVIGSVVDFV